MKNRKRIISIMAGLTLGPLALWAASPGRIEKTIDTTPDPEVSVANMRGQIVVRGWEKSQVHALCNVVSPRVEIDSETMPKAGKAERLQLTTRAVDPSVTGPEETADCTIQVPSAASIEIRNRQGAVQIEKLEGEHARVESADGKITASDIRGHLVTRSMAGDIEIIRPAGRVEAFSITGNLSFKDPASKSLRGNTNSGRIVYQGDFMPTGDYILSTYSGDIEVALPASASFDLTAKTVKGKVDNTFSLTPKRHATPAFPSANSLLGTHSTGDARVELTSFNGRIRVRQQP
jgi:hypothetical protein